MSSLKRGIYYFPDNKMIQIDDTLVSLDLIEANFICDLAQCKGFCCVEGDSGAPLEKSEIAKLEKALPVVNNKDCVFTCYDNDGTCKCAIEKAYREGKLSFYKPVSCHLYPVRVTQYKDFRAVNYDRWKICKAAEILGQKEKLPLYKFLKEPLIRKFGEKWYESLVEVAEEWRKQKEQEKLG